MQHYSPGVQRSSTHAPGFSCHGAVHRNAFEMVQHAMLIEHVQNAILPLLRCLRIIWCYSSSSDAWSLLSNAAAAAWSPQFGNMCITMFQHMCIAHHSTAQKASKRDSPVSVATSMHSKECTPQSLKRRPTRRPQEGGRGGGVWGRGGAGRYTPLHCCMLRTGRPVRNLRSGTRS